MILRRKLYLIQSWTEDYINLWSLYETSTVFTLRWDDLYIHFHFHETWIIFIVYPLMSWGVFSSLILIWEQDYFHLWSFDETRTIFILRKRFSHDCLLQFYGLTPLQEHPKCFFYTHLCVTHYCSQPFIIDTSNNIPTTSQLTHHTRLAPNSASSFFPLCHYLLYLCWIITTLRALRLFLSSVRVDRIWSC